jgi:hypothetical protein
MLLAKFNAFCIAVLQALLFADLANVVVGTVPLPTSANPTCQGMFAGATCILKMVTIVGQGTKKQVPSKKACVVADTAKVRSAVAASSMHLPSKVSEGSTTTAVEQ